MKMNRRECKTMPQTIIQNIKKVPVNILAGIYIILNPLIDIITSIQTRYTAAPISVGAILRPILIISIIAYTVICISPKNRKKLLIYISIALIYLSTMLFYYYNKYGWGLFITQLSGAVKTFNFPIVLITFYVLNLEKKVHIDYRYFITTLVMYSLAIILPMAFGISEKTYDIGNNAGYIGLFFAGNDISIAIVLLFIVLFAQMHESYKNNMLIISILVLIPGLFVIMMIGTKTPFLGVIGLLIIILLGFIYRLIFGIQRNDYKLLIITMSTTLILFISFGYTAIGQNMGLYNFGMKLPQNDDLDDKPQYNVLSGRDIYKGQNLEDYKSANIFEKIIGLGYLRDEPYEEPILETEENNMQEVSHSPILQSEDAPIGQYTVRKLCEMDFWDILVNHGIIGFVIFFIPLAVYFIKYIQVTIKKGFKKVNLTNIILTYAVLLTVIISYLSGHTFVSPSVSTVVIMVFILALNKMIENDEVKYINVKTKNIKDK